MFCELAPKYDKNAIAPKENLQEAVVLAADEPDQ